MAKVTTLRTAAAARAVEPEAVKPVVRTAEGVRNVLFDEIDALRNGTGDRRRASTIAQLVGQIVNVAKIEVEYQRHLALIGREGGAVERDEAMRLGVLRLGTTEK